MHRVPLRERGLESFVAGEVARDRLCTHAGVFVAPRRVDARLRILELVHFIHCRRGSYSATLLAVALLVTSNRQVSSNALRLTS